MSFYLATMMGVIKTELLQGEIDKMFGKDENLVRILIDFDNEAFAYEEHQEQSIMARKKAIERIVKLFKDCVPRKQRSSVPISLNEILTNYDCNEFKYYAKGYNQAIEEMNARIERI